MLDGRSSVVHARRKLVDRYVFAACCGGCYPAGIEPASSRRGALGLLHRRMLKERTQLMVRFLVRGRCRFWESPKQERRSCDILACAGKDWRTVAVLANPLMDVTSVGTCTSAVHVMPDLALEHVVLKLELSTVLFELLLLLPQQF